MERYPPYKILITFLLIAIPVGVYFWITPPGSRKSGFISNTSISPALVYAVPEIARKTRKGADLPVQETVHPPSKEQPFSVNPPNQPIELYCDSSKVNTLFTSLNEYFTGRKSIRILHFGDSQLEEDRITRYFRQRLLQSAGLVEGDFRVEVVNLPKRGSAGIDLTSIHGIELAEYWKMGRPDLILFQFGINVVRARTRDFGYYTRALSKQISRFRDIDRDVPILIIGVSDMANRDGDQVQSYATVPHIRDAQREAARENHCIFWDLYTNMGGTGSALQWYMNDPPLIREDLTHFSWAGGKMIADQLFDAIMWEYRRWKNGAK